MPVQGCYVVYSKYFLGDDEPMIAVADSLDRVREIDERASTLHPGIEVFWQRTPWYRHDASSGHDGQVVYVVSNGPLTSPVAVGVFDDPLRAATFADEAELRLKGHHVAAMVMNRLNE